MPSANNESRDSMAGASPKLSKQSRVEGLHIDDLRGLADGLALTASVPEAFRRLPNDLAWITSAAAPILTNSGFLGAVSATDRALRTSGILGAISATDRLLKTPAVLGAVSATERLLKTSEFLHVGSAAEPIFGIARSISEIGGRIDSLTRVSEAGSRIEEGTAPPMPFSKAASPFAPVLLEENRRRETIAEKILEHGWVPNHTMPFALVAECGNNTAKVTKVLLTHYNNNWLGVRPQLEMPLSSYEIGDHAKAIFREALDNHEDRRYSSVVNLLFLRFEKMFCTVLFPERRAGPIRYVKILNELYKKGSDMYLGEKDFSCSVDSILFNKYLTKGADKSLASCGISPNGIYMPGLATRVDHTNIEFVKQSPIPNRNAVAHGWVDYSSQQNSLNAIFIADHVFSVVSRIASNTSKSNRRYIN